MPAFPLAILEEASDPVGFIPDEGGTDGIDDLTQKKQITSEFILKLQNVVQVNEEVTEPHRRAQVIVEMADAVRKSFVESEMRPTICVNSSIHRRTSR